MQTEKPIDVNALLRGHGIGLVFDPCLPSSVLVSAQRFEPVKEPVVEAPKEVVQSRFIEGKTYTDPSSGERRKFVGGKFV